MYSIMEKEKEWRHLGTAFLSDETHLTRDFLEIATTPELLKQFSSFSHDKRWSYHSILSGYVGVAKLKIGESDLDAPAFKTVGLLTMDKYCSGLTLKFSPYHAINFGHQPDIDIDVYYLWKDDKNFMDVQNKHLHLRMKQESIPWIPKGTLLQGEWNFLGVDLLDEKRQEANELCFEEFDAFLNSFPKGRMKDRIHNGFGVRAVNVYIHECQMLKGLQLKVREEEEETKPTVLVLSLGQVLQFKDGFRDKRVELYYRWCGEFLELGMKEEFLKT